MSKITGLNELTKQLDAAARAAKSLDGEIGTFAFDPNDRASVDGAIQAVEAIIDRKLAQYEGNPLVAHFSARLKASYRDQIILRSQTA